MNKLLLKRISILSIIAGMVLAFFTLIPFINVLSFFMLMCLISVFIAVLMTKLDLIEMLTIRESVVFGAVTGFISFMAFSAVYLPIIAVIGKFFNLYNIYPIALFLNAGSFGIIFLLAVFTAVLSAVTNAFSAFLTFYLSELLHVRKKNIENSKFEVKNE